MTAPITPITVGDLKPIPTGTPAGSMFITQQVEVVDANRQALIDAATALPKSPSMQALLTALAAVTPMENDYRVAIANIMTTIGAVEHALADVRQQVMAARLTTQDNILAAKLNSITPTIDGVLDRFREVARQLNAIEDGLSPLDQLRADINTWAGATGYTATP